MSSLSGRCDLLDHINGLGGWYTREGKPVKFGDKDVGAYYSDIYQDFLVFKKKTNGVMHQHKRIKEVNRWNQDFVEKNCPAFKIIEKDHVIPDKRTKTGERIETEYFYEYYGKLYTDKELKKRGGVYITVDIHFNNLLELAPYFPYIVTCAACDKEKEHIVISNEPWPEEEYNRGLQNGFEHSRNYYVHKLAEYTRELTLRYFNPAGREVQETLEVKEYRHILFVEPTKKVDTDWPIDVVRDKHDYVFGSPFFVEDPGVIDVTKVWPDLKEGDKITVKYIEWKEKGIMDSLKEQKENLRKQIWEADEKGEVELYHYLKEELAKLEKEN